MAGEDLDGVGGPLRHNLREPLTSFVGRAGELDRLEAAVQACRLVTVVAAGGCGKTRLVCELGRRVVERFADGVWLVELAPLTTDSPELVAAEVAAAIGVQLDGPGDNLERLVEVLRERHLLLLVDNCEHVIDAAAAVVAGIVAGAVDVRVVATSRERLAAGGERLFHLPPLEVGSEGGSEAADLFVARAGLVAAELAAGTAGAAVGRIVSRLDGLPLAIELVAGRLSTLGLDGLEAALDADVAILLDSQVRGGEARHRSLRAAIDWSYRLLDPGEQRVWRRLSVFAGPFTLDAARAVAGPDAMRVVPVLVERSLVQTPSLGVDGRSRYGLFDTLKQYAHHQLAAAGELPAGQEALWEWAMAEADSASSGLKTPSGEADAARRTDTEYDNLRSALQTMTAAGHAAVTQLGVALTPWWILRGRLSEGAALLRAALAEAPDEDRAYRVAAMIGVGVLERNAADHDATIGHLREAVLLAEQLPAGSGGLLTEARFELACADLRAGRYTEAMGLADQIEAGPTEHEAAARMSWAHLVRSEGALYQADFQAVLTHAVAALTVGAPSHLPPSADRRGTSLLIGGLFYSGDVANARRECELLLDQSVTAGATVDEAWCHGMLSEIAVAEDRLLEAAHHRYRAVRLEAEMGLRFWNWESLGHMAIVSFRLGNLVTATQLLAARDALGASLGGEVHPLVEFMEGGLRDTLKQGLTPPEYHSAATRGARLTLNEVVDLASVIVELAAGRPITPRSALSRRERELVALVAQGRTDKQIAEHLFISIRTVRSHLDRIRDKTGCRRRADLTRMATETGLV